MSGSQLRHRTPPHTDSIPVVDLTTDDGAPIPSAPSLPVARPSGTTGVSSVTLQST